MNILHHRFFKTDLAKNDLNSIPNLFSNALPTVENKVYNCFFLSLLDEASRIATPQNHPK